MPDSYVQVAPDVSGGKMLHTRERTVGANTIQEQYVIPLSSDRVVSSRAWFSSLCVPNIAATSAPVFSVFNSGTDPIAVRRLSVEVDATAASAAASPYLRLYRVTAAPTGGTQINPVQQDTNDTAMSTTNIVVRAAHGAEAVASAITATPNPTQPMWAQTIPRFHTLVGYQVLPVLNLVPDDADLNREDPLILRNTQGLLVRLEAAAAPTAAVWQLIFKCVIGQFTTP